MKRTLTVVDNFAPDATRVRSDVIEGGAEDFIGPNDELYTNTSRHAVPKWHEMLEQAMGFLVDIKLAGFRFDLAGEYPHNQVHADVVMGAKWAGIVYLNPPEQCRGGTSFHTHARTGLDSLPTDEELIASGHDPIAWKAKMERDWQVQEVWNLTGLVSMRFNRLAVYPTAMFHSRFPREGFGTNLQDGRLIWIVFFNEKEAVCASS